MGYHKGSIQLNPGRDIPLLRQTLRSAYSTKQHLYEFMQLTDRQISLQSFGNRLQRLVKHGLIQRHDGVPGHATALYSITSVGMDVLIGHGETYAGRGTGIDRPISVAQHALELNELQLTMRRAGLVIDWMSESEICSRNILTTYPYAKDYDAVLAIRDGAARYTVALEYERSMKSEAEYNKIAEQLTKEIHLDVILYIVTTRHLIMKLTAVLYDVSKTVCIGLAKEFQSSLLQTQVSVTGHERGIRLPLIEVLQRSSAPASRGVDVV